MYVCVCVCVCVCVIRSQPSDVCMMNMYKKSLNVMVCIGVF